MELGRRDLIKCGLAAAALHPLEEILAAAKPNIQVEGPNILRNGAPYRAVGCNFYDALDHDDPLEALTFLRGQGIPFVRFNFGAYAAGREPGAEWRGYLDDRARWYGRRDDFVAAAETVGVGLVPSLFWRLQTLPDLMAFRFGKRDALSEWGRSASNTRNFMRQITSEVVERYRRSPAIWGWEAGNEFSDVLADPLTKGSKAAGAPSRYKEITSSSEANGGSDLFTLCDLRSLYEDWGEVVVRLDHPARLRSTGEGVGRVDLRGVVEGARRTPDTRDEWLNIPDCHGESALSAPLALNPRNAANVISAHIYQQARIPHWWFEDEAVGGPTKLLALNMALASQDGRPLFLGEFGSLKGQLGQGRMAGDGSAQEEEQLLAEMVDAIVNNAVPLSAVWNYGYLPDNPVRDWNFTAAGRRAYVFRLIADANERLAKIP